MAVALNISMILILYIVIMAVATVFVYRDAKKRNMNGGMWPLIAFVGPFLLGVIIYFVCRNPITDLQCSKCGATVQKAESNCPKCGTALLVNCPECQFPIQKGWQSCPKCGTRFPEEYNQPVKTYKKESGVGIIILIVVLAVVCLGFVACALFATSSYSYSGYGYEGMQVGMYNITEKDFRLNSDIVKWVDECKSSKEDIHILYSEKDRNFIVFVKDSDYLLQSNQFELNYTPDGAECCLYINELEYEDLYGYDFYYFEISTDTEEFLEVDFTMFFNGNEKKVKVTKTDAFIGCGSWEVE